MRHAVWNSTLLLVLAALGAGGCGPSAPPRAVSSSTLALTHDDAQLWVVNPDSDTVSVIDTRSRALVDEVLLAGALPAYDGVSYEPAVRPRALALSPDDQTVWVAGQASGTLYAVDAARRQVTGTVAVGAEPTGVVASSDGREVYVVNHQSGTVSVVDAARRQVVASIDVGPHPWGAALSADGKTLWVTRLLVDTGVVAVDVRGRAVKGELVLAPETAQLADKRAPNGTPRGAYAAAVRPGADELWVPHLLLAVDTPQPDLDFESTVFPTVSRLGTAALEPRGRLLFQPLDPPGIKGSFSDSVSGPRAIAFTPDGARALVVFSASEDVLVFDGATGVQKGLVRPLPGTLLEGVVVDSTGAKAYVDGRGSHDVTVLALGDKRVTVDGDAIERLRTDPMPAQLRLGQRLFFTANSAAYPITKNFWVSCASCHLEGGSDAVTWRFEQGPRDTPANFGGTRATGFLFRQATRNSLLQYDKTIDIEQGGAFHKEDATQRPLLEALAAFVDQALPLPRNPHLAADGTLSAEAQRGQALFADRCASCHAGPWFTDSGAGNPTLDFAGPVVLHDVGTCVTSGPFPDKPSVDDLTGSPRAACAFDTPSLRGVFATGPWLHDGSAATLDDAVRRMPNAADLSPDQLSDLVAYVQSL